MVRSELRQGLAERIAVLTAVWCALGTVPVLAESPSSSPRSKLDAAEEDASATPTPRRPKKAGKPRTNDDSTDTKPDRDATSDTSDAPASTREDKPSGGAVASTSIADERLRVCDWIAVRAKKGRFKVQLQPNRMDDLEPNREYTFFDYRTSPNSKAKIKWTVKGSDIEDIKYYEQRVIEAAAQSLGTNETTLTQQNYKVKQREYPNPSEVQQAIETLRVGIKEHDSAAQRKLRNPKLHTLLRMPLLRALYNLELTNVDSRVRQGQWAAAADKCDELGKQFRMVDPTSQALVGRYDEIFAAQAKRSFDQQQFADARDWLSQLEQRLGSTSGVRTAEFRRKMMHEAREQVRLATASKNSGNREAAAQYLDRAKEIWPELSEIDTQRQQWDQEYPILHCAYLYLPQNFAPFAVRTPVERHAASLIFESLVRWTNASSIGPHYRMCLAEERPVPLAFGRQFTLRHCEWWDQEENEDVRHLFSAEDVMWTKKLQAENPWAFEQIALLDSASHHGDPFRVDMVLKMDHWQPLSFMDFWILPKYRFQPDQSETDALRRLNEHPVGTGPYYLAERRDDSVHFRANPRFREKGRPLIKEIHFDQMDPTRSYEQFVKGRVDLVHGIRKVHRDELSQAGRQSALMRLNSPSIYFLAPNYDLVDSPLKDKNFRLAIAHAIDRGEILNQYFRENEHDQANQALTGPFPKDSWAYNNDSKTIPPFKMDNARAYLQLAQENLKTIRPVTLCYPDDDPDTENACRRIQENLQKIGIEMKIESVAIRDWHRRIIQRHDFELAYWRHDFLNETYWLWPLFDPNAKVMGTNFISYDPDQELTNLFNELRQYKRFTKIRELTHQIHEHIARNAIVIPLWQLDTYLAVSDRLKNATLDPWALFGDVQHWSLLPQRP